MSETTIATPANEATNGLPGAVPMARRDGPRGMLPSTWMGRSLRVEYTDSEGSGRETSGIYLDHCPVGIIMNIRGARTLIAWDRIGLAELVE